ncbi:MAG: SDR family NAD(P)-dependent oxidoreductase [Paracoccaceae bacterium]|nr:SDR family NAD(P)-dependent oxidoreductase [Paracoccaceae bacterium]
MTKIALVTGASRGLGAALAEALAPEYHVVAVARTVGGLEELDDRIKAKGGAATLAPIDITDEGAVAHLCRSVHDRWGPAALWVHTAVHAPPLSPAPHAAAKDFDKTFAVTVTATQRLIRMVGALLAADGRAVFFDDPRAGQKFFSVYGAAKAAQIALAHSWAAETERTGPKVAILTPAPMPTAVRARFFPGEDRGPLADPGTEARRLLPDITG